MIKDHQIIHQIHSMQDFVKICYEEPCRIVDTKSGKIRTIKGVTALSYRTIEDLILEGHLHVYKTKKQISNEIKFVRWLSIINPENLQFVDREVRFSGKYSLSVVTGLFNITDKLGIKQGAGGYAGGYYQQLKGFFIPHKYRELPIKELLNVLLS